MQAGHQTQAHRLREYFESNYRRRVFPGTYFAHSAVEIGPRSEHHGPCSVLFSEMELDPQSVLHWFHTSLLRRHVTRLYILRHSLEGIDGGESRHKMSEPAGTESTSAAVRSSPTQDIMQGGLVAQKWDKTVDVIPPGLPAMVGVSIPTAEAVQDAGCPDELGLECPNELLWGCCEGLDSGSRTIRGDPEELLADICLAWTKKRERRDGVQQGDKSAMDRMVLRLQCFPRALEKFLEVSNSKG